MINKKISIIVPIYNSEKFLEKCLKCLLGQTYKNLEVILVNDGSKGNCKEIYEKYKKIDNRVVYVEHDNNRGLFQARITGVKKSTGDYIAFLDSDDHVTIDYFRALIYEAEKNNSDITFSNMILEYSDGKKLQYNYFDSKFNELNGNECLDEFFNQEGLNFSWHTTPNKIYSRRIWELALVDYQDMKNHLVMTEDFSFSSVLFYYAQKVIKVRTEAMYYCKHDEASTSVANVSFSKIEKNLKDLTTSFNFVENFLRKKNVYDKYEIKFKKWKSLYCNQHKSYIENIELSAKEKKRVNELFTEFCKDEEKIRDDGFFSSVTTDWDESLDNLKARILDPKIKCVSFDIFDTLIVRPFLVPKDLFKLLNKHFIELNNGDINVDFSNMRVLSEDILRRGLTSQKQEITIDEIYELISKTYNVSESIIQKMKVLEKEYEIHYCTRRNTAYQLYELAKYLNKKVVCTSDMYLDIDTIRKILEKNGYSEIDEIFISSEHNATKVSGDLFLVVSNALNLNHHEIIHIGDNHNSDYEIPQKLGFNSEFFPRAISIALDRNFTNNMFQIFENDLPFWEDNLASTHFIGIRCMLAVVANKYFDNPYRSFNKSSNYNADPELVGYYILGMYLFGVAKWLSDEINDNNYESIVFMARDGFLPMKAYNIIRRLYKNIPEEKYLYVSRKALIPVVVQNKNDYYKIPEVINIYKNTPNTVFSYIKDTVDYDVEKFKRICKLKNFDTNKNFSDMADFKKFIDIIISDFYNEEKHKKNLEKLKSYYSKFYNGKSANFDIGYSGRPEYFISKLCKKNIDTFFININSDEAIKYSKKGNFKLNTFFDFKPHLTGNFYEFSISAMAPSCIGYNFSGHEIEPIFEKYTTRYQEEFVIKIMQESALEFVNDMVETFGSEISELYYQRYYVSLPMQSYVHSSNVIDKGMFSAFTFEDDVRSNQRLSVIDLWEDEKAIRNQHSIENLLEGNIRRNIEISHIDLSNRSKIVRLIYYTFFDRITLKRRVNEILFNHKILKKIAKKTYNFARKIRRR